MGRVVTVNERDVTITFPTKLPALRTSFVATFAHQGFSYTLRTQEAAEQLVLMLKDRTPETGVIDIFEDPMKEIWIVTQYFTTVQVEGEDVVENILSPS